MADDMMSIFLAGVEEIAKNMKEQTRTSQGNIPHGNDLERKIDLLAERIEKLLELLDGSLTQQLAEGKPRGKRMMDIKKRIGDVIKAHPEGIRPPQIAQIIGTRVQNLYPHLKEGVEKKQINKDASGVYSPVTGRKKK